MESTIDYRFDHDVRRIRMRSCVRVHHRFGTRLGASVDQVGRGSWSVLASCTHHHRITRKPTTKSVLERGDVFDVLVTVCVSYYCFFSFQQQANPLHRLKPSRDIRLLWSIPRFRLPSKLVLIRWAETMRKTLDGLPDETACQGRPLESHERKPRGNSGSKTFKVALLVAVFTPNYFPFFVCNWYIINGLDFWHPVQDI